MTEATVLVRVPASALNAAREALANATARPWRAVVPPGVAGVSGPKHVGCYVYIHSRTSEVSDETVTRWQADARAIVAAVALADAALRAPVEVGDDAVLHAARNGAERGSEDEALVRNLTDYAMFFATQIPLGAGQAELNAARSALLARLAELRRERDGFASALDMEQSRVAKLAKCVDAVDYVDSIGPIFVAIDKIIAERDSARSALSRAVEAGRRLEVVVKELRDEIERAAMLPTRSPEWRHRIAVLERAADALRAWDALDAVKETRR